MEQDGAERCGRCGNPIASGRTAFVVDEQVVCRACHDELRPMCPYCQADLPGKPAPYSRCPKCDQTIYIRTRQDIFDSVHLTREQADEFDALEARVAMLKPFGITPRDFLEMKRSLAEESDEPPADLEVLWQLFLEAGKRTDDPMKRAELLYLQARFIHAQGKAHLPTQARWARTLLTALREQGYTHVRIEGLPDRCVASRRLHGQVVPIEEALKSPPVPCVDCNYRTITDQITIKRSEQMLSRPRDLKFAQRLNDKPFCECRYIPVTADGAGKAEADKAANGDAPAEPDVFGELGL